MEETKKHSPEDKQQSEDNFISAISYIWILCLVPLFLRRDSAYVQHHAKQGLLLFAIEIVGWVVFSIPVIGWLLGLLVFMLAVIGFVQALSGNKWDMPFLGRYAEKINL